MSLPNIRPEDLGVAKTLLAPLASLYGGVVKTKSLLYAKGIFKRHRLGAPVISVGNLTTGGTGKTSLVIELARTLVKDDFRICVLTRGYGRESPRARVIVSDGENLATDIAAAGDEPRLIAESVPGVTVIADPDRAAAGKWAINNLGSNLFLLDDGFQHLRIERDIDIVTIDATNPWGGGYLLPRGLLREQKSSLSRAHIVLITRANQTNEISKLKQEVMGLNKKVKVFTSDIKITSFRSLNT
ncbi:MAG: tetraacyldisaccharide 4'-kinase, partial [Pyrinomonadaceae bacterium]